MKRYLFRKDSTVEKKKEFQLITAAMLKVKQFLKATMVC